MAQTRVAKVHFADGFFGATCGAGSGLRYTKVTSQITCQRCLNWVRQNGNGWQTPDRAD